MNRRSFPAPPFSDPLYHSPLCSHRWFEILLIPQPFKEKQSPPHKAAPCSSNEASLRSLCKGCQPQ